VAVEIFARRWKSRGEVVLRLMRSEEDEMACRPPGMMILNDVQITNTQLHSQLLQGGG
jgi:hypothetical protein